MNVIHYRVWGRVVDLIHNERTKYMAASLDRLSTACVAVGVFAQLSSLMSLGVGWVAVANTTTWIVGALALHWAGRIVLGGLRP